MGRHQLQALDIEHSPLQAGDGNKDASELLLSSVDKGQLSRDFLTAQGN